jgi:Holliday junction resolvasome RuvABC endonuclease subunit
VLHIIAASLRIPCVPYHVSTVKLQFTGDGRASKEDTIKEAKKYVKKVVDDNHADAIAVWYTHQKLSK